MLNNISLFLFLSLSRCLSPYRVEPPSNCSTISQADRPTISICLSCLNPKFSAASNNFFLHS